jgi:hypothetical protein
MYNRLAALLVCLAACACTPTVWDKPGATQDQFNQDSARCRLLARGMNSGDFYAQGSSGFVEGAVIGNAIGTAINQAATFHDCMMATGYTPSSGAASVPSSAADRDAIQIVGNVGAFAYSEIAGRYGYSWNEATETAADAAALKGCGSNGCRVVFRIGPNQCGAIATTADGKIWGGARRGSKAAAELAAMHNCQKRGLTQCNVRASECNQ